MKKATITLHGMKFYAYHGCFEEEQQIGNYFIVDLSFSYNAETAIANDNVENSINYQMVYLSIQDVMNKPQHLIETVANNIISQLKTDFPNISDISVKVCKLNPPLSGKTDYVAVEISE